MSFISDNRPVVIRRTPIGAVDIWKPIWTEPCDRKPPPGETSHPSIVTVPGYDWRIKVRSGCLLIEQPNTDPVRLEPGQKSGRSVWLLADGGWLTGDAISWCWANGVSIWLQPDDFEGASATFVSLLDPQSPDRPKLRKAQYLADPLRLSVTIIERKLAASAQAQPVAAARLNRLAGQLRAATSVDGVRAIEAQAARCYWREWRFPLRFSGGTTFPTRWRMFAIRCSALTRAPRRATHPINAMLNYGYAVIAAQLRRAIVAKGLDPAYGYLHANEDGRSSLLWDLIEPLRPKLDVQLLSWAKNETWKRSDFSVDLDGHVTLTEPLARIVVHKALLPERLVADEVDWFAKAVTERGVARPVRKQRRLLRGEVNDVDPAQMLIPVAKAASAIGVHRQTLYDWFESGELSSVKIGGRRFVRAEDCRVLAEQKRLRDASIEPDAANDSRQLG